MIGTGSGDHTCFHIYTFVHLQLYTQMTSERPSSSKGVKGSSDVIGTGRGDHTLFFTHILLHVCVCFCTQMTSERPTSQGVEESSDVIGTTESGGDENDGSEEVRIKA